jgi:hypothetical protein
MKKQANRIPPALRHGVYSGLALLPGEDPDEFKKFVQEIVAEYNPTGRSEQEIVKNMACFMWRRQNLETYRIAKVACDKHSRIYSSLSPPVRFTGVLLSEYEYEKETRSPEELDALRKQADKQAERELGAAVELVEVGDVVTIDYLEKEIPIVDRLDNMIDRCLKRLLFVRGLKSLSAPSSAAPSPSRLPRAA